MCAGWLILGMLMADPKDFVVLNGLSHHLNRDGQNEFNVGGGMERRLKDWAYGGGILKDSNGNWSPYISATDYFASLGPVNLGLTGSLSHREAAEDERGGLTAFPMLSAEYMVNDESGLNLGLVPPMGDAEGLLFLQYKHLFGGSKAERSKAGDELERLMGEAKKAKVGLLDTDAE